MSPETEQILEAADVPMSTISAPTYSLDIVCGGALDESFEVNVTDADATFDALVSAFRADPKILDIEVVVYEYQGETLRSWNKADEIAAPFRVLRDSPPDQIGTVSDLHDALDLAANNGPDVYVLDTNGLRFENLRRGARKTPRNETPEGGSK